MEGIKIVLARVVCEPGKLKHERSEHAVTYDDYCSLSIRDSIVTFEVQAQT